MQTLTRRKMFNAIVTAGTAVAGGITISLSASGLSKADVAVALAFDDKEYFAERTKRLEAHVAHLAEEDAHRRAARIKSDAQDKIIGDYLHQAREQMITYDTTHIKVPKDHYHLMSRRNLIDFIPDAAGVRMIAVLTGIPIDVV